MSPPPATTPSTMSSTTTTTTKSNPSYRVGLGDVTPNNIGQLKRLNTVMFPVVYAPSFYKDILEVGEFAKLIYFNDVTVGAVCCRKEPIDGSTTLQRLYIMTLGVLAPYRRLGLGSKLLEHILEHAVAAPVPTGSAKISEVYLHVQINNDEAVEFYKKHGFEVLETCKAYYPQFEPSDAFKLRKVLIE